VLTRGRIILLGVTLFCTYGYFYQSNGWNQDSRFDMVRAIVERGTLKITAYHHNTGDKSRVGSEYFSDKAPGHALLAVPFVATARLGMKLAGADPVSPSALMWLLYLSSLMTAALPATLAVLGFLWLARRLGASDGAALFGGLVLGVGTPLFSYATVFWVHALAAALLLGSLIAAVALRDQGSRRRDWLLSIGLGLSAGWATISEYPAAITAVLVSGLALLHVRGSGWPRMLRLAGGIAAGALPCLGVLMAYNLATFGSPFSIGYQHQVNFAPVSELFKLPNGNNLGLSLFGEYRGLLLLSPVLVAAPLGLGMLMLEPPYHRGMIDQPGGWKAVATFCWVVPAYYFLLNSSYAGWFGGWCYGPRNVASGLALLALGLSILWTRTGWFMRVPLLLAGIYGMAFAVLAASVTAQPSASIVSPIAKLWWANFKVGKLSLFPGSWNWGHRFGLTGLRSLVPLLLLWLLAAATWVVLPWLAARRRRRRARSASASPSPSPYASPSPSPTPSPKQSPVATVGDAYGDGHAFGGPQK
jgi:hypothetical protein